MTSAQRRAAARRRATVRRRQATALALLAIAAVIVGVAIVSAGSPDPPPAFVRVELGGRTVARRPVSELQRPRSAIAMLAKVPASRTVHRDSGT
jgi:hypothetical protein